MFLKPQVLNKHANVWRNSVRKMDIHMQKNTVGPLSYTIYKNYLKVDWKPKCKTQHRKTPRKYRGKNSWHWIWQWSLERDSKSTDHKSKNRQMRLYQT